MVLGGEPLLELTAPLPQAQLVETWVLNQISHQTALASKAARCVIAARGRPVVDFSLRRTHGIEAGLHAARAGAIVGFATTGDVAAARVFGMRASGTMAHSFVEVFDDETAAFRAFASSGAGPVTLLVDTYDTEEDVLAVGTKVGTVADAPYLDAAYKLVEYAGRPVMKLSEGKVTLPGAKQVFRGRGCADVLGLVDEVAPAGSEPLLETVMHAGRRIGPRVSPAEAVDAARGRFRPDLGVLPAGARVVRDPVRLRPRTSARLQELTRVTRARLVAGREVGVTR